MDDMNAFEHLVTDEVQAEAGPSRPIDVAAVTRAAATKYPKWRFRSMFSATKMLAATAVVALFGGVLAVGQLTPTTSDQAPAAEAALAEPVEFQARWVYGTSEELPGYGFEPLGDGWASTMNTGWRPGISNPGDPRLDGSIRLVGSNASHGSLKIWNGAFRIENEDGAWQQRPLIQSVQLSGAFEPMSWTAVFDGEGDYAGLAAVTGITRRAGGWDVEGVIVDAAVLPEPPTTLDFD